jgi:ATP-dependent DNA helicase RecQ
MGLEMERASKKEPQPSAPPTITVPTRQVTLEMYQRGLSIEEIATERNLKAVTIEGHIAELIEMGEIVDGERLVRPERYEVIAQALENIGSEVLKPVKEFLGDEYSYGEIRLARAIMNQAR